MSESNLFPEKELIDVRFLDLIKYDDLEIANSRDVEKAIREFSCLINTKKTKLMPAAEWEIDAIEKKRDKIAKIIDDKVSKIQEKIENYYNEHWGELKFQPDENNGEVSTANIEFEHGQIIITQKTKNNFKIKPKKGD